MKVTAIIVEDEKILSDHLKSLLIKQARFIEVIDQVYYCNDAIRKIDKLQPDIIFLDILLQDGDGFFILENIIHKPYVIFTTSYNQYALKAFESDSIDYLLKPLTPDKIKKTIGKIKKIFQSSKTLEVFNKKRLDVINFINSKILKLPVKFNNDYYFIKIENINYINAYEKYTIIHTVDNQELYTEYSLKYLEKKI